jgi:hypothetical protein
MKPTHRLPRAWVRLGAVASVTGAFGFGAVSLLVDEQAPRPAARTATSAAPRAESPAPVTTAATLHPEPARAPEPARPASVGDVQAAADPADLARWVGDATLEPTLRYAALRRLEAVSPAEAVTVAATCAQDPAPLLQKNALALLARADSPLARAELARLDSKDQRLARALAGSK